MESTLLLGTIKADKFKSDCMYDSFTLKLFMTRVEIMNKNVLSIEDELGEKYPVNVCPPTTWHSFYSLKNGNGYRYKAGPYFIESLNILGFENSDIPLFSE